MDLTYVIGDIHGHLAPLEDLLARVEADAAERADGARTAVFVGDYIDRGPDSAGVLARCFPAPGSRLLPGFETVNLPGNHEWMFLSWLLGEGFTHYDPRMENAFRMSQNGGPKTILSFGLDLGAGDEALRAGLRAALPAHVLERLVASFERPYRLIGERFVAVHAGFLPGVPIEEQPLFEMLWIRWAFLRSTHDFGRIVVHGHTPMDGVPAVRTNRINVDTGSYKTGVITAAVIGDDRLLGFLRSGTGWIGLDDPALAPKTV